MERGAQRSRGPRGWGAEEPGAAGLGLSLREGRRAEGRGLPRSRGHRGAGARGSKRRSGKMCHEIISGWAQLHVKEVGKKEGPCSRRNFEIIQFTELKEWMWKYLPIIKSCLKFMLAWTVCSLLTWGLKRMLDFKSVLSSFKCTCKAKHIVKGFRTGDEDSTESARTKGSIKLIDHYLFYSITTYNNGQADFSGLFLGLGMAGLCTATRRRSGKHWGPRPERLVEAKGVERGDSLPNRQIIPFLASEPEWWYSNHSYGIVYPWETYKLNAWVCEVPEGRSLCWDGSIWTWLLRLLLPAFLFPSASQDET